MTSSTYRIPFTLAGFAMIFAGHVGAAVIHVVPPEPIISGNTAALRNQLFDVNDDGTDDFLVENDGFSVSFVPFDNNAVSSRIGELSGREVAPGIFIGSPFEPPGRWQGAFQISPTRRIGPDVHACSGGFCTGDFSALGGFLGLEFDIGGATHYGWARLRGDPFFVRLEVLEWAYETEPGQPIIAGAVPEPGGAALLGLAAALLALRRRRALVRAEASGLR